MFWVILGIFLMCLPTIIEHINAQIEENQEILNKGYEIFGNEDLKNLTIEEQLKILDDAWKNLCSSNKFGTRFDASPRFLKLRELVKKGTFTDRCSENNINDETFDSTENYIKATNEAIDNYMTKANEALANKNYELSIEYYTKCIDLCNSHPYETMHGSGYEERAEVYIEMGEYENAIKDWTTLMEIQEQSESDSLDPDLYKYCGIAYLKLKNYQKSLDNFCAYINDWIDFKKNYEKIQSDALEDILIVVRDKSNEITKSCGFEDLGFAGIHDILVTLYLRGIVYYNLKKYDEAIKDFKIITDIYPQYKDAKTLLNKFQKKEVTYTELFLNSVYIAITKNIDEYVILQNIPIFLHCGESRIKEAIKTGQQTKLVTNINSETADEIKEKIEKLGAQIILKDELLIDELDDFYF